MTPRTYRTLAAGAGAIGLAVSAVATWFYVLGLLATETDAAARQALIAAGVLLTVGQLAAFGLAALLPRHVLRGLRCTLLALGAALFAFEVAGMAVTQLALVQTADVAGAAAAARIVELQAAIDARRAVAAERRTLAAQRIEAGAVTAGAALLRQVDTAEADIAPLASELQQLQASRRPTLTTLLGAQHVALYATLRSALIALVGLVMTSAAGALWRTAQGRQADTAPLIASPRAALPRRATPAAAAPVPFIPQPAPERRSQLDVPAARARDRPGQVPPRRNPPPLQPSTTRATT